MNDLESSSPTTVRVDRWLWAARLFKTRSLAAKAIVGGKVQVNGKRAKRASHLRLGDRLRLRKGPYEQQLIVRRLSQHRGPASEAVKLYEETQESLRARESLAQQRKAAPTFDFREKGRPSKKERRQLRRLKTRVDTD
ncbi:MAG: RNA-binding protein [Gemmatimonadota bacterium]|nr:MAG: RNA-binding protein [Gemmatimonadota bacterium]